MRYLITALLTIALVAPFAWSRINTLPSDGEAAAAGSTTSFRATVGMNSSSAIITNAASEDKCLPRAADQATPDVEACGLGGQHSVVGFPFYGTATLTGLGCFMQTNIDTAWTANDIADMAVYEVCTSTRAKLGTVIQIKPSVGYTGFTDGPGWSTQSAVSTCTSGGWLQVVFETVVSDGAEPFQGQCTFEWTESR